MHTKMRPRHRPSSKVSSYWPLIRKIEDRFDRSTRKPSRNGERARRCGLQLGATRWPTRANTSRVLLRMLASGIFRINRYDPRHRGPSPGQCTVGASFKDYRETPPGPTRAYGAVPKCQLE